jgi:ribosomal protein S18 acetylase RimI-like enzyme
VTKTVIRPIEANEVPLLIDFLYEAIFQPKNTQKVSRTILQRPEIWAYGDRFGTHPGDMYHVGLSDGVIVGAVWSRLRCSYGKIDDATPELAISIYPEYRGKGLGSELMDFHLAQLENNGCKQISLSVDKANYAVEMYHKFGFEIICEREHDYLMLKRFCDK